MQKLVGTTSVLTFLGPLKQLRIYLKIKSNFHKNLIRIKNPHYIPFHNISTLMVKNKTINSQKILGKSSSRSGL